MSNFNKFERRLASVLSKFPVIKKIAKRLYSFVNYLKYRKSYLFLSAVDPIKHGGIGESFFGYYDKSPLSPTGNYLLYQQSPITNTIPATSTAQLVCENIITKEVLFTIDAKAFNWQQGCKPQWISNTGFIYNDYDATANKYISKIVDVENISNNKALPFSVYDCFKNEFALCLSYERLAKLSPDYGYFSKPLDEAFLDPNDDGIWLMCLKTGASSLLLTLESITRLASINYQPLIDDETNHTVNHIMISPNGNGFIFIHRYYVSGQRFDRLIHSDIKGNMSVIACNEMVSHCFWIDDNTILGYLRGPSNKDGYWLVDIKTRNFKAFAHDKLAGYGDGHPNVKGDWFVTDSYPDKARMQHLLLCNLKTEEVRELGQFFHGFQYDGETRCDLHPRFSADGESVFFDSVFTGRRHLYQMDVTL
jgi:hypothetical protein